MSTPCKISTPGSRARSIHRAVVITAGAFAVAGTVLALALAPVWGALGAVGALILLLCPETQSS